MQPANDDEFYEFFAETAGELIVGILVTVGAVTAFVVALAVTL